MKNTPHNGMILFGPGTFEVKVYTPQRPQGLDVWEEAEDHCGGIFVFLSDTHVEGNGFRFTISSNTNVEVFYEYQIP